VPSRSHGALPQNTDGTRAGAVPLLGCPRPAVAIQLGADEHQPWVELAQRVPTESEPGENARGVVLDHDVDVRDEVADELTAGVGAEIGSEQPLVADARSRWS